MIMPETKDEEELSKKAESDELNKEDEEILKNKKENDNSKIVDNK